IKSKKCFVIHVTFTAVVIESAAERPQSDLQRRGPACTGAVRLAQARPEAAGGGERGPESPREPEPWEGGTSARAGALEGRAPVWARAVDRPDCPQALTGPLEDRLQIAAMSRSTSAWVAAAAVGPPPPPRTTLMPASSAMIAPPA